MTASVRRSSGCAASFPPHSVPPPDGLARVIPAAESSRRCPKLLEEAGATRHRLVRGETLFRPGEPFSAIYAIRSGSCKTVMLTGDGREQITPHYIRCEFVGVEGVANAVHHCEAVALEDSEVCVLPFARLEEMARANPQIQRSLYRV